MSQRLDESAEQLAPDLAFEIVKFYENALGRVKDMILRTATWILALESALLAFHFSPASTKMASVSENMMIAIPGAFLSVILGGLIYVQGSHISEYVSHERSALRQSSILGKVLDLGPEPSSGLLHSDFPNFCKWLLGLSVALFFLFVLIGLGCLKLRP